ncbi:helix-turn-helix domain-containing protein [Hoyosella altamirensis]|uniref:helix-turn-helix domain-containing protein n=1 Tax=Hoyosella altamirensis TaxID=616997 RepID=UPI0007DB293F|nr:helix-turn-helix transcriptional regulator [Hoyosella altamirensis]
MSKRGEPWEELTAVRDLAGFRKTDLAKEARISLGHLSDLESGRREPTAPITRRLATALNVPVSVIQKRRYPHDNVDHGRPAA